MSWEVYIIEDKAGKLYTGITNDLDKRFNNHKLGKGARFFRFASPEKIIYREKHSDRSSASKRESAIKKMNRSEKLLLVGDNKI